MTESRRLLQHFVAALAYRTQSVPRTRRSLPGRAARLRVGYRLFERELSASTYRRLP